MDASFEVEAENGGANFNTVAADFVAASAVRANKRIKAIVGHLADQMVERPLLSEVTVHVAARDF